MHGPEGSTLSLTLGREVHGVSLHGVRRAPLARIAVSVVVAVVSPWEGQRSAIRGQQGRRRGPLAALGSAESAHTPPSQAETRFSRLREGSTLPSIRSAPELLGADKVCREPSAFLD